MTDIVQRLRASSTQARAIDRSELLEEAAQLIESQRLLISVLETSNQVTRERLSLTDAERDGVERAIGWIESPGMEDESMPEDYLPITTTLRGLLERLK